MTPGCSSNYHLQFLNNLFLIFDILKRVPVIVEREFFFPTSLHDDTNLGYVTRIKCACFTTRHSLKYSVGIFMETMK